MRGYVYHGREDVRLEELPDPEPGEGEAQIRVAYNGICGSDLHEFYAGPLFLPTQPHPRTGFSVPMVTGHEAAGVVTAVGPGVEELQVGDRVALEPFMHLDGPPKPGSYQLGMECAFYGYAAPGTCAEMGVFRTSSLHKLPDGISMQQGALVEPMAVGYHAAQRTLLKPGETALVFGAGPIGTAVVFALRTMDLADIFVVEPSATRREQVARWEGVTGIDPAADDVTALTREATGGTGVQASVDTAGVQQAFDHCLTATATEGRIVIVAGYGRPVEFNPNLILLEEKTITTSCASAHDFPTVLRLMDEGAYPMDGWVEEIAFDRVLEDGYPVLHRGEAIKLLIDIGTG